MLKHITRRKALATGTVSASILLGSPQSTPHAVAFPKTWGEDFLTPWSPPEIFERDLIPGPSSIRLSCSSYRLHYSKDMNIVEQVKNISDAGYTACESMSSWLEATDSQIRELKDVLKEHDIWFYGLHIFTNNIHPDLSRRQKNQKRVAEMVESAERLGLSFIVTHTGSCSPKQANFPHRDNWTKKTWDASVRAIKQVLKDTAGSTVNLGIEALNPCNINNPWSHIKFREDVGDPRVKVTLDPQNMLNTTNYYRTTELINTCFDLLGEDILYAHAKDVLWTPRMLPAFEWVVAGTGTVDFETYLVRLSRLKYTRALLLEFLSKDQYPAAKKYIEETAARVGVKIHG